jgi:accessory gene regulator B
MKSRNLVDDYQAVVVGYGINLIVDTVINLFLLITFGLLTNSFVELFVFFTFFTLLRFYCGGFHASTRWRCLIISGALIIIVFLINKWIYQKMTVAFLFIELLSTLLLWTISPIASDNKPLSRSEKGSYSSLTKKILVITQITILFSHKIIAINAGVAVIIVACSSLVELLRKQV